MKGIVGTKVGMTQIFDEQLRVVPVTVIKAGPCRVAQVKTVERDGYSAVQMAFGATKPRALSKAEKGHLTSAGLEASKHLVEFRLMDSDSYEVGQEIRAGIFEKGERADVVGVSKGKGFAGVMKRHGFAGKSASHGTDRKHRSPGSVGACATPSRVFRGMKMAGHMGAQRVTVIGLEVVEADSERNLILVKGAVPGPNGGMVMVRSTVRSGR